jgi:hypothetical protein
MTVARAEKKFVFTASFLLLAIGLSDFRLDVEAPDFCVRRVALLRQ